MTHPPPRGCRARWPVLTTLVVLLLAGCANSSQPSASSPTSLVQPAPTTTPTPAATTAAPDPKAEVLAAYRNSWSVLAEAYRTLDPSGLEAAFAGRALQVQHDQIAQQQAQSQPVAIQVTLNPSVLHLEGDRAVVADRYRNQSVTLDPDTLQPTGTVQSQEVVEHHSLARIDGVWKVTEIVQFQQEDPSDAP